MGNNLHCNLTGVHVCDSLRSEFGELSIEAWDGSEALVAGIWGCAGGAREEVLLERDDWSCGV